MKVTTNETLYMKNMVLLGSRSVEKDSSIVPSEEIKKEEKGHKKEKGLKMREKERRDNVTILYHTCASK